MVYGEATDLRRGGRLCSGKSRSRYGLSRLAPISKGKGKAKKCKMPAHIWSNNIQRIEKADVDVDKTGEVVWCALTLNLNHALRSLANFVC